MRFLLAFLMIALIANPAWSAFNGPSAAHKEIVSVVAALESA